MRLWNLATRVMGVTLLSLLFATPPLWAEMTVTKPTKPVKANGSTVNLTIKFTGEEDLPITLTVTVTPQEIISDLTGNGAIVNISKGKGTGKVSFRVLKNETSLSRSIDVTINTESFTITQAGQPCKVSIAPTKASFDCPSGAGSFDVTAPKGCQWKAWNADETADDWIKNIVAVKNDEGGGSVSYSVEENLGKNRSGKILVAGFDEIKQTDTAKKTHTVAQKAAPPCKVAISPSKASFTYDGGEGSIDVTAPDKCEWTVTTADEWITITPPNDGEELKGNRTVFYTVDKNLGKNRSGKILVAGIDPIKLTQTAKKTHTVAQNLREQIADLAGTWRMSDLGSPGPWWSRGTFIIDSGGSFSGDEEASNGETFSVSGTFSIDSDGIITATGEDIPSSLECVMDSGKSIFACTGSSKAGKGDITIFTKKAESFSPDDLFGIWGINTVNTPGPWWSRDTFIVGLDGSFSSDGTGMNWDGTASYTSDSSFSITPDGIVTVTGTEVPTAMKCAMDSGKSVIVCTSTSDTGHSELHIITKKATSYSVDDVVGKWKVNQLSSPEFEWIRGTLTFDKGGSFSGKIENSEGSRESISGTFSITPNGTISVAGSDISPSLKCVMDSDKSVIACTSTADDSDTEGSDTEILVLLK